MSAPLEVIFNEIFCSSGKLGRITLNNPRALNSLNLGMLKLLNERLHRWAQDPDLKVVFLESSLEKAFCAGGDVKTLALEEFKEPGTRLTESFFEWEYKTDYQVHRFPKPIIAWLDGVTMGGGIGISRGAQFRISTETTTMAMPETAIGFFPDVGAGYFLNEMPFHWALFLGWTGARLSGALPRELGFATHFKPSRLKRELLQRLMQQSWVDNPSENTRRIESVLSSMEEHPRASSKTREMHKLGEQLFRRLTAHSKEESYRNLTKWKPASQWGEASLALLKRASPLSLHLTFDHLNRCLGRGLKEVFEWEWNLAVQTVRHGDFKEGVRAVLVDKDGKPRWKFPSFYEIPQSTVDAILLSRVGYVTHLFET